MFKSSKPSKHEGVFLTPEGEIRDTGGHRIPAIALIVAVLTVAGLINLYSASLGDVHFYAQIQRLAVACFFLVLFGWIIPLRVINQYAFWFYAVITVLLVIVLINGHTAGGSQRWINLGFMGLQPSELAKLAVAIAVAKFFFINKQVQPYRLRDLWLLLTILGGVFLLIFEQPDLGTAGVCILIAFIQLMFIRIDMRSVAIASSSFLIASLVGWIFFLREYQKLRILNLFNPKLDPSGSGYNSIQSLVAIGSGRFSGKGLMHGTQTQLQFLPARHTDFIFSVFAEEHGFWAGALTFILFGLLTYYILEVARHASDSFTSLLAIGVSALIFIEFTINLAMVLGMFPVVGMPLPFFSYGGSSMLTNFMGLGIIIAIERHVMGGKRNRSGNRTQMPTVGV